LFCLNRKLATKETGHQKNLFMDPYDPYLNRFSRPNPARQS